MKHTETLQILISLIKYIFCGQLGVPVSKQGADIYVVQHWSF